MAHCAGRLGLLSYLYQERHTIALTIGLIVEKPIATCSHEYNFNEEITIQDDGSENAPAHIPSAQEINLYFTNTNSEIIAQQDFPLIEVQLYRPYSEMVYISLLSEIFQPPRIS